MAEQNAHPAPWNDGMSDGCTSVLDWLPVIGDMSADCAEHDHAYYLGGTQKDKDAADQKFKANLRNNIENITPWLRWAARPIINAIAEERFIGVRLFADGAFNWLGPGPDRALREGK